jgi:hypothetical protein
MSLGSWWFRFRLLNLSKPASDRSLYRAVQGHPIRSVLEIGLGDGHRARTLIDWLGRQGNTSIARYGVIDLFETAPGGMPLKETHKMLAGLGVKPMLVPGEPASALQRVVHTLGSVDLLVCADHWLEVQASPMLSRVVHNKTLILAAASPGQPFAIIPVPASAAPALQRAA